MMKARLQSLPYGWRLLLATVALGIGTGLVGIACHFLLDGVQKLAFGQERSDLLQQFREAGGLRRFLVLSVTGLLAAGFWYVLQKRYKILSIRKQIDQVGDREPAPLAHILHASMQVAIVGAGTSVGKEGAPREVGALIAGRLGTVLSLTIKEQRVLIACGAGAGLAAVYQIPFASSLFVFETLGLSYRWKNVLLVLSSTYLAAWVAQPIVGHGAIYHLSPLAFMVLAGIVIFYPIFMGNGQVLAQAVLSSQPFSNLSLILVVKGLLVYLLLSNGAYGGTLTPSFALGIGSGYLVTMILSAVGVQLDPALGMLLGATVFLGTTLQAPMTAIALSLGFTGQSWALILPLALSAGVSYVIQNRWENKR